MSTTVEFRSGEWVTLITRTGADTGPGYVLVHGIGMAHEYWSDVAEALGRSGTVYALDLPGFGEAPAPEHPPSMAAAGDMLAELVRSEGIERPVLIGHSAGAQVVAEAAARHPQLFDRIVLIGPTVNPRERSVGKQAARLAQDLVLAHPKVLGIGLVSYAKAGLGWYLEALGPVMQHRIEETLPRIPAQTLVIRGERDRIAPRYWAEQVASRVQRGRLVEVPGRGHETMITAGPRVADLIARHARGEAVGHEVVRTESAVRSRESVQPDAPIASRATVADAPARLSPLAAAGWWALDYLDAVRQHLRVLAFPKTPRRWSTGDADKPTVLLLPGVYEHWSFMAPLGDDLNRHGYRVQVVHGLGANLLGIFETAARMTRALERTRTPAAGFVMVAHSKGGLVGKRMMLGDADRRLGLLGVVAIATPFGGSRLARYLLDPGLREFLPDGATIMELSDAASMNSQIVSVFGTYDPHLPEGSVLAGATNVQVPVAGHFRILAAPETFAAVIAGVASLSESATTPATPLPTTAQSDQSASNGAA
ncbi:alpha/beta fold hydrolase [Agromyces sp. CCNWLW203]|uniref:alpha/beta fold hydrolase n=1 Tax=Agromyces sp. CCNWLW203 TaxID=3112842 RepID=UPI002F96323E